MGSRYLAGRRSISSSSALDNSAWSWEGSDVVVGSMAAASRSWKERRAARLRAFQAVRSATSCSQALKWRTGGLVAAFLASTRNVA